MNLRPVEEASEGAHAAATGYPCSTLRPREGCKRVIYLPLQLTEDGALLPTHPTAQTPITKADDR